MCSPASFTSLLIPPALAGGGIACAHTAPEETTPLRLQHPSSPFQAILQGLANPVPGHGGEIAGLQSHRDTGGLEEVGEN